MAAAACRRRPQSDEDQAIMSSNAYAQLERRFARMGALNEAAGMLHWDMAAVMPEGGHESRAEQLATLNVITHEMLTATETADLLALAGDSGPRLLAARQSA